MDVSLSGEEGLGGASALFDIFVDQLEDHHYRDRISLDRLRCLMACTEGCTLSIAAPGKMQYLLGRLSPEPELVSQILDFAKLYDEAPMGITDNAQWPSRLALHFLGRIPPVEPEQQNWRDDGCNL